MNFEDESYVRLYKRKTLTSKLLGWEGRTVLWHLMLEVDRAGVLDLDGHDAIDAVAAMTDCPIDVVRVGMPRLIEREVVKVLSGALLIPKFIEAQETRQSDAQRQRDSRERRRALIRLEELGVTIGDLHSEREVDKSQSVTEHPPTVTNGHSSSAQSSPVQQSSLFATTSPPAEPAPTKPKAVSDGTSGVNGDSGVIPRRRPTRRCPTDWTPKPAHELIAQERRIDLAFELAKFRDHEFKTARVDWDAAARNWLRNANPAAGGAQRGAQQPKQPNSGWTPRMENGK
jgi:hypothetical protein